jgi:hypothetical protein
MAQIAATKKKAWIQMVREPSGRDLADGVSGQEGAEDRAQLGLGEVKVGHDARTHDGGCHAADVSRGGDQQQKGNKPPGADGRDGWRKYAHFSLLRINSSA